MSSVLSVRGLTKSFAGQRALDSLDLDLEAGEVRGLVGQNGSGKSTLIKILSGFYVPDEGTVSVNGEEIPSGSPLAPEAAGLRFVHQDLGLIPSLGAVDNLALGRGYTASNRIAIDWRREAAQARERISALGHSIDVRIPIRQLTASQRTAIAIARALAPREAATSVLVLDEPTASLPASDADRLLDLVRQISASGVAVLFVSHHLAEVMAVADSVTVLRNSKHVVTSRIAETSPTGLIRDMLGRELQVRERTPYVESAQQRVLETEGVNGSILRDLRLQVCAGEIVGVAGITGSGREEIAGVLFGGTGRTGRVSVAGKEIPPGRPDLAVKAGMGLVPSDRHAKAAFMDADLRENVTVVNAGRHLHRGRLSKRRERGDVEKWLSAFKVRPADPARTINTLSGGNQQKVVLARWLRQGNKVLILDDPTQGVDVGAKAEIYDLIDTAARDGAGVVVISNDEDELSRLCTRVVVLRGGRVRKELTGDELTSEEIAALSGGAERPSDAASSGRGRHGRGDHA